VIAALYVEERGVYSGLEGVDVWGVSRDARRYAGPYPVVAHPPCERWGRYWHGGPNSERFPREPKIASRETVRETVSPSCRRLGPAVPRTRGEGAAAAAAASARVCLPQAEVRR
jgi:hypothetical protein